MDALLGLVRWGALDVALVVAIAGCGSASTTGAFETDAAAARDGALPSDAASGGIDAAPAVDAGPLHALCDPDAGACANGLPCFAEHTAPGWGCGSTAGCQPDLFGHCYRTCEGTTPSEVSESLHQCAELGGVCGCPVLEDGGAKPCSTLACVPALP